MSSVLQKKFIVDLKSGVISIDEEPSQLPLAPVINTELELKE